MPTGDPLKQFEEESHFVAENVMDAAGFVSAVMDELEGVPAEWARANIGGQRHYCGP